MERAADLIIRKLNEAGADHIFMISGRGILYLTDAVARNQNIKNVCTYHEQGASYAAMAYAAQKNGIAVCLVSTGCASTNAVTASLCAYQDNLPVVFLSGNNPLIENTHHTGIEIRTYGSQEVDIIPIVSSITKYAVMLEKVEDISAEIEKALYLAQAGRKGPVWIDVPLDIQNMQCDPDSQKHFTLPESRIIQSNAKSVADELDKTSRPILLVGGGCVGTDKEIAQIVETFEIPVVFSPSACDIYGSANQLSIGAVGSLGGSRAGNFAIQNSDYVLAVGTKLCSQLTGDKEHFAREANITVVDIDEKEHLKNNVKINHFIHCDAKVFFVDLLRCGCSVKHDKWAEKCKHWKNVFSLENEEFLQNLKVNGEIDIYSFATELEKCLPDDASVITDAGFEELIIPSAIRYKHGQRCLFPAAQGAMGYAIPAVIGAHFAGSQNIICVVGDGSLMMNVQELGIISANQIPAKIFIINNNMYSVIRKRQHDLFRSRTIGTDPTDGVPAPNISKIATSFKIGYHFAETRDQLISLLPDIMKSKTTEIIEVISESDQKYFHESYARNEQRRIVRRPIEDMSPFLDRELIKNEMIVPFIN